MWVMLGRFVGWQMMDASLLDDVQTCNDSALHFPFDLLDVFETEFGCLCNLFGVQTHIEKILRGG